MKNKYLFCFFLLILSLFLIPNNVYADYEAVVFNSSPKCDLHPSATGKCIYADKSFQTLTANVLWLDIGDEVLVYENEKVNAPDQTKCSDYYVKVRYNYSNNVNTYYYGYYCHADLRNKNEKVLTDELKQQFQNEGFPESYWEKLAVLKTAHPNWTFKAAKTELDFYDAVNNEAVGDRSLVQLSSSNNYALLSTSADSFDYINDKFKEYDNIGSVNPWLKANKDTIAYYMDPRNFLIDMYLFQFENLSYDSSIDDATLKTAIDAALNNDYLQRYTDTFIEAGKQSRVNPIYLAALAKQEVGGFSSPSTAINGLTNGMYNFYNIGATGGANPVLRGLEFASYQDDATMRPWNTPEKGIIGGGLWIAQNYVSAGQSTSYFKRFNVVYNYLIRNNLVSNPYQNYWHQYMTNTMAPASEAITTYRSYVKNDAINTSFTFLIPVYENMPDYTALPTKGGWPNNYLKSITVNGKNIAEFNPEAETYNYYLDINNPKIKLEAKAISNSAKITGTGEFTIQKDQTLNITVIAQNGNQKTYNINVKLTGEKRPDAVDVQTTITKAGFKNNDKYIRGISIGTDASVIKDKIHNSLSTAKIVITNSNSSIKDTGKMVTGDKITITVGDETKTFEVIIKGDVNGDGEIFASDYVKIKNHIMDVNKLSGPYILAADVNGDGEIFASDYVKIKNHIMGGEQITQ